MGSTLPCELSLVRQGSVSHHQFTFALSLQLKTFFFAGLKLLTSLSDNLHRDLPFLHSHLSLLELQMQGRLLLQLLLHARYRAGDATHPEDWKKYYSSGVGIILDNLAKDNKDNAKFYLYLR